MRTIDNQIFTNFLYCKYKAYLKLQGEAGHRSEYEALEESLSEEYREHAHRHIADSGILVTKKTIEVTSDVTLRDNNISVHIDALVKEQHSSEVSQVRYIPVIFNYRNKITKNDKLLIAFVGEILARKEGLRPEYGRLIHGDEYRNVKVNLTESLVSECDRTLAEINEIGGSNAVPPFRLNKHCSVCEYQEMCHSTAVEKDDLSLLSGLGDKEITSLNNRGIFTVTQFSYTFRPRKRSKRAVKNSPKHYHSLNALALRNERIYIASRPVIPSSGMSVYLDIEGIPDRDSYYLVGILISDGDTDRYHSFWADSNEDEEKIWQSFLDILDSMSDFTLYHYGSYESVYLDRMQKKYGGADIIHAIDTVNVLSLIYAHVYFPTYSNGLKSIANYLGFQWSSPDASGIRSVVWRYSWERTNQDEMKHKLINYNYEDCLALQLLTESLIALSNEKYSDPSKFNSPMLVADETELEFPITFKANNFVLPDFDKINKRSYFDYQRSKVYLRTNPSIRKSLQRQRRNKPSREKMKALKVNKESLGHPPDKCKYCGEAKPKAGSKFSRTVYDLKFIKGGIKRWIVRYRSANYTCRKCGRTFVPEAYALKNMEKYGLTLRAYIINQIVARNQTVRDIGENLRELFGYHFQEGNIQPIKAKMSIYYTPTYQQISSKLRSGGLIHADETQISTRTGAGYVWIFANMEEVLYVYADTREGHILDELLDGFEGVLVSDFYTAYDSVECIQQKCHIHLIRDINNALLGNPFDEELKSLAEEYTKTLSPIIETIDRYGLKKYHLNKHKSQVDRFFKRILDENYSSENAQKFQQRFRKYEKKLFTFLDYDGVPWNNNNAEHMIKRVVRIRQKLRGLTTAKGAREYCILLSICETLRLRNLSFLDFLVSGCLDIDEYAKCKR